MELIDFDLALPRLKQLYAKSAYCSAAFAIQGGWRVYKARSLKVRGFSRHDLSNKHVTNILYIIYTCILKIFMFEWF